MQCRLIACARRQSIERRDESFTPGHVAPLACALACVSPTIRNQTMESERRLTSSGAGAAMLAAAGTSLRFPTHVAVGNNAKR